MSLKVAVTAPEYKKAEQIFAWANAEDCQCLAVPNDEQLLAAELRQQGIHHVIVGITPYRGPLYEALGPGGVVARFGVGHDSLDKGLATARGVLCTNTPGVLDDSVAEHTLGLILALARHVQPQSTRLFHGEWAPQVGIELKGKTLAVLGCGGIGRRVAQIASRGFGMSVVGFKKTPSQSCELQEQFGFNRIVTDFEEAMRDADFVSLHLPSTPETRHFLNRSRLAALPVGSFLINTARGALVDEIALFDALSSGRIAGAALDVFEQEPYQPGAGGKDLRGLANVLLTPHCGSSTREACDRMAQRALRNVQLAIAGRFAEMDLLNPDVLQRVQS